MKASRNKMNDMKVPKGYAVTDAKIATYYNGKRIVKFYRAGQPLVGKIFDREDGML